MDKWCKKSPSLRTKLLSAWDDFTWIVGDVVGMAVYAFLTMIFIIIPNGLILYAFLKWISSD